MSGLLSVFLHLLLYQLVAPVTFRHSRYDDLVRTLYKVHNECPYITRVYSIGRSVKGRHLYVLEFSDNPGIHEPCKPQAILGVCRAGPFLYECSDQGCGLGEESWGILRTPPPRKYRLFLNLC